MPEEHGIVEGDSTTRLSPDESDYRTSAYCLRHARF
jgi:hypothetical protein